MDKLFRDYTIEEISLKTKISPMFLEKLKNRELDGISEIKLKGFIYILKNEYPKYDFSELENIEIKPAIEEKEYYNPPSENNYKVYFIVIVLLALIAGLIYYMQKDKKLNNIKHENTLPVIEQNFTNEKNMTLENEIIDENITEKNSTEKNISTQTIIDTNITKPIENNITKIEFNKTFVVIPKRKVWFRITYLDTNKSKEYLTKAKVELNISKEAFIKFGHGQIDVIYNNKDYNWTTKKVLRLLVKNGECNKTEIRLKELQNEKNSNFTDIN